MMNIVEIFAVPNLVETMPQDLKAMIKYVRAYTQKNKSVTKSNRGGYQSDNLYYKPHRIINKFVDALGSPVRMLSNQLRLKQGIKLANIWFNINKPGDSNMMHTHSQSIISGVYYVQVPRKSGDLIFHSPAAELISSYLPRDYVNSYDRYNSCSWSVAPKEGTVVLFPSWLRHHVEINESKKDRITLSFNYSFQ